MGTSPLPSRGPIKGQKRYVTPTFFGSPNAKRGKKIIIGCLTCAFLGAQKRAKMLRHRYILGRSPTPSAGTKLELVTSPVPSPGPKKAWKYYVTPAVSGVPNAKRGDKITSGAQVGTLPMDMHFLENW